LFFYFLFYTFLINQHYKKMGHIISKTEEQTEPLHALEPVFNTFGTDDDLDCMFKYSSIDHWLPDFTYLFSDPYKPIHCRGESELTVEDLFPNQTILCEFTFHMIYNPLPPYKTLFTSPMCVIWMPIVRLINDDILYTYFRSNGMWGYTRSDIQKILNSNETKENGCIVSDYHKPSCQQTWAIKYNRTKEEAIKHYKVYALGTQLDPLSCLNTWQNAFW
jgi:hypothetical protein